MQLAKRFTRELLVKATPKKQKHVDYLEDNLVLILKASNYMVEGERLNVGDEDLSKFVNKDDTSVTASIKTHTFDTTNQDNLRLLERLWSAEVTWFGCPMESVEIVEVLKG